MNPDAHPIEGTWLPTKAELDGDAAPAMALAQLRLVLRAGSYAVRFGGEISDEGHYALRSNASVQTITLTSIRGTNAGRTLPSIFQLAGDRLRICYGLAGVSPTSFAAPVGSQCYLVSYRRGG